MADPGGHGPDGAPGWVPPPMPHAPRRAIWVFALGIASPVLLLVCLTGLPTALVALYLAPGAKREIRSSDGRLTGEGLVLTGVICGWISVALGALALLLLIALVAWSPHLSFGDSLRF